MCVGENQKYTPFDVSISYHHWLVGRAVEKQTGSYKEELPSIFWGE
jgi:hypothetical protein